MTDENHPAIRILNAAIERSLKGETISKLPSGTVAVHAIDAARTFGNVRSIEKHLLVEDAEGIIRRINGAQLAELADLEPEFVRRFAQLP